MLGFLAGLFVGLALGFLLAALAVRKMIDAGRLTRAHEGDEDEDRPARRTL